MSLAQNNGIHMYLRVVYYLVLFTFFVYHLSISVSILVVLLPLSCLLFFIVIVTCMLFFLSLYGVLCLLSIYFCFVPLLLLKRGLFINVRDIHIEVWERKRIEPSADYLTVLFNKLRFHWIQFLLLYAAIENYIHTHTYTKLKIYKKNGMKITRQMPNMKQLDRKRQHLLMTLNSWHGFEKSTWNIFHFKRIRPSEKENKTKKK